MKYLNKNETDISQLNPTPKTKWFEYFEALRIYYCDETNIYTEIQYVGQMQIN